MIPRFSGACLGLFAFTVSVIVGLIVGNPITVILSRSILMLFVFFLVGVIVGTAAQKVIHEHERKQRQKISDHYAQEHEKLDNPPKAEEEAANEDERPQGLEGANVV